MDTGFDEAIKRIDQSYKWSKSNNPEEVKMSKVLDLSRLGLTKLPDIIEQCVHATHLLLNWNNFVVFPDVVYKLTNLNLFLINNNLLKVFPVNLEQLPNLTYINLSFNHFGHSGITYSNIPNKIGNCERWNHGIYIKYP